MPCYSPLAGYYSRSINPTGKRSIVFNVREAIDDRKVPLPCGQCIGCRLERSRQWAIRCVHEASLYSHNSFITLTYNSSHLPLNNSLNKVEFPLFMKRLRKRFGPNIRYFHCGEYGERSGRPHYHACLFNFDFRDKVPYKRVNGYTYYTSEVLSELWPQGFSTIGDLTFESAAYVARYVLKKITGPEALDHYTKYDRKSGEVISERLPEYTTMSRRPGIGRPWLEKFLTDVYPEDFVVLRGKKLRPPKYYDAVHGAKLPFDHDDLKERRQINAARHADNNTSDRLFVREYIQLEKIKLLKRNLDNDS